MSKRHTRFLDVLIAAALSAVTLSLTLYFAPRGFNAGFVDMAHDGYQLRQAFDLHRGATLFRDTFEQYGLLTPYFNQLGLLAFGERLLAIKYFVALWYGATAIVMYVLARQFVDRMLSVFSVLLWVGLAPFYQHGIMLSPHAYVLFFQALAIILAIRGTPGERRWRWWTVGALCGICCLFKQSLGTLFFAAFGMFLLSTARVTPSEIRRLVVRLVDLSAGFVLVVLASLTWLFAQGALHDWYLQTIVFPKAFYLDYYRYTGASGGASMLAAARLFVQLQSDAAGYWLVLRAIVVAGGLFALIRRRPEDEKLALAAWVTLLLWLAAFPSANYMHQWWTISLTLSAAVYALHLLLGSMLERLKLPSGNVAAAMTVAVIGIIVSAGLATRWNDGWRRAASPSESLVEPKSLSGIKIDPLVRRSMSLLYAAMTSFRAHHPGTSVLSIDSHEGVSDNAESLLLLSFFEDNPHPGPIYWNLPVLSNTVYAAYPADFQAFVRKEQPLIVDYQNEGVAARVVPGYFLLAAATTLEGCWFLYAPRHEEADAHGERQVEQPKPRPRELAQAGPQYVMVPLRGHDVRARAYTAPAGLSLLSTFAGSLPSGVEKPANASQEVQISGDQWIVDGLAATPDSYLLQLPEQAVTKGASFVAVGILDEGGATIGLQSDARWAGYVNVTQPGAFVAVLAAPHEGLYTLTVANCVTPLTWPARIRRDGPLGALEGWWRRTLPNSFRITAAGWVGTPIARMES